MPKLSKDFPAQLSLQVTEDMRLALIAIGYDTGNGGEYATPARNLLHRAIQDYVDSLPPRRRAEYEQILANVRTIESGKQKSPA